MKLLQILVGTLVLLGLSFGIVRFYNLGQSYPVYDNGFWGGQEPRSTLGVLMLDPKDKIWTLEALEKLVEQHPGLLIHAGVKKTEGGDLVLGSADKLAFQGLEKLAIPMGVALEKFTHTKFIFDVLDNVENIHELVAARILNAKASRRVIIASEYDLINSATKELAPDALYGSSSADRMRFNAFDSMFLVVATPFKGDVYTSPLKHRKLSIFGESLAAELKRRNKPLFLGPVSASEWDSVQKYAPAAIGSYDLDLLVQKLNL